MSFKVGDIIYVRNIKFKDNKKLDTRLNGHPAVIIGIVDNFFYYLILSSNEMFYLKYPKGYFKLIKDKRNKLKKDSYVNFRNVYKSKLVNYVPIGEVRKDVYTKLIKALKKYKYKNYDDVIYNQIRRDI